MLHRRYSESASGKMIKKKLVKNESIRIHGILKNGHDVVFSLSNAPRLACKNENQNQKLHIRIGLSKFRLCRS